MHGDKTVPSQPITRNNIVSYDLWQFSCIICHIKKKNYEVTKLMNITMQVIGNDRIDLVDFFIIRTFLSQNNSI